jgi:hypothetical protein
MHPAYLRDNQMNAGHAGNPGGSTQDPVELAETLKRLHALRMAALSGGHYDPDEFDEAVLSFRRAWEESRQQSQVDHRQVA